jgi:hypothetical protein
VNRAPGCLLESEQGCVGDVGIQRGRGGEGKTLHQKEKCFLLWEINIEMSSFVKPPIPTRGNLFLPVRLGVWADGRGTVEQADSAARAEHQGASKQKLLQLKNVQKYHWVEHREMLICCLDVCPDM